MATATSPRFVALGDTNQVSTPTPQRRVGFGDRWRSDTRVRTPKSNTPYADMLASIKAEQREFYESAYQPLLGRMVEDVNSTAIVDAAKEATSEYSADRAAARGARRRARLGVTGTAGEAALAEYQAQLGQATLADASVNQARVKQKERNDALRTDLINISRGIQSSAIDSAANAASSEGARNAANANADAQNKAARNQTYGTLAAMALMFMV